MGNDRDTSETTSEVTHRDLPPRGAHAHASEQMLPSSSSSAADVPSALSFKPSYDGDRTLETDDPLEQSLDADGASKRPMNVLMIFARRWCPQLNAMNPTVRMGQASQMLSEEWRHDSCESPLTFAKF